LYSKNIQNGSAFVSETSSALDSIQSEVSKVLTTLTELNNPGNQLDLTSYANQIDMALKAIMNSANSKYDGKYLFGGTDFSSQPYDYTSDGTAVETKADVSGSQVIKISPNITQKINMTGTEIFGTIVSAEGNFDVNGAVGSLTTGQTTVYDALGNQYTFAVSYEKTAANNYEMSYDIIDSGGSTVYSSPSPNQLSFDSTTGKLKTINGDAKESLQIKIPNLKIDFTFDLSSIKEKDASSSLTFSANQQVDIFNTLIAVKESLLAGELPSEELVNRIKNFNSHVLDKTAETGNIINQLNDTEELIGNRKLVTEGFIAGEMEVDVAKAIIDLQQQDYLLQVTYKLSAMILPKSILDFL
jgi:flagellin-like hook-associated protein FlgL